MMKLRKRIKYCGKLNYQKQTEKRMLEIFQKVTMDVLKGRRQNVWWKVFKYLTKDLFSDIKLPFEY